MLDNSARQVANMDFVRMAKIALRDDPERALLDRQLGELRADRSNQLIQCMLVMVMLACIDLPDLLEKTLRSLLPQAGC
jgi:hypothetical protein